MAPIAKPKIIAQTSKKMSGDKDKCLEIGFVDYIPKPITKDKLIETLGKWMS
jgi:CheY-like chemotaxis protein